VLNRRSAKLNEVVYRGALVLWWHVFIPLTKIRNTKSHQTLNDAKLMTVQLLIINFQWLLLS